MSYKKYAHDVLDIAKEAGKLIMGHYNEYVKVEIKEDDSPVTQADIEANDYIVNKLLALTPDIPIVSEENDEDANLQAKDASLFWLVDPLDGTKSFIKHKGEFTVNIALISEGKPCGGAVYVPAKQISYYTAEDGKAYKQDGNHEPFLIHVRSTPDAGLTIVASLSHRTEETDTFIETLPEVNELISASSSVKFCLVAEGQADVYPRFGRTMEWDTAAGHAVVLAAGGSVVTSDGIALSYGKDGLDNPYFIVYGGCV